MKKIKAFIILILACLTLSSICSCGEKENTKIERIVYLKVNNDDSLAMTKLTSIDKELYQLQVTLALNDKVSFYDNNNNTFSNYSDTSFNGVATLSGKYLFKLEITEKSDKIYVTLPTNNKPELTKLDKPVVTLTGNVVSWSADSHATKFVYVINDGSEIDAPANREVTLTDGQSIKVKAVGDGTNYTDSDWSAVVTYTAPAPTPIKLDKPVVTLTGNVASWSADTHATKFVYVIGSGSEIDAPANREVTLTNGQSIKVKAIGDGSNYTDSDWSNLVTYTSSNPVPTPEPEPNPQKTVVDVVYTNSEGWNSVYAYVWNSTTEQAKQGWPGEALSASGTSSYGEKQYKIEIDFTLYDRIIFNNGNNKQTKDLVVGPAVSGYYGTDGIFTNGTDNYGNVRYVTLKDTKNLSYLSNSSKKISIYTPSDYNSNNKYGVIYMFDSQNLYASATGAENSHDSYGSWCVDVAINNLVNNGYKGVIIVAIDTTDGHRDSELTMSQSFGTLTSLADNNDFRNGKLDNLGDFIKETVMPWVKSNYSIDSSKEKTGIAGSSSGGLAAYYLGLRDNNLYGYIGAFSPANGLFTSTDWNRFYANKNFSQGHPFIYVYCGKNDNSLEDMLLPATMQIKNLTSYGFSTENIVENYVNGGTHSENYWRIAFQEFVGIYAS